MSETEFRSSLSMEEIEDNFKNTNFFDCVMEGLNEALAYEKGVPSKETISRKRSLPDVDVAQIRNSLSLTQKAFASVLGVSKRTVEAWEAGRTTPSPTARKLLYLISLDHSLIFKLQ